MSPVQIVTVLLTLRARGSIPVVDPETAVESPASPAAAVQAANQAPLSRALTRQESRVVHLIQGGYSNKRIAAELSLSSHTVKAHVRSILQKLQVKTREAAARVIDDGEGGREKPRERDNEG
jgi:DNA-binding NarL/FixJ family response regulator